MSRRPNELERVLEAAEERALTLGAEDSGNATSERRLWSDLERIVVGGAPAEAEIPTERMRAVVEAAIRSERRSADPRRRPGGWRLGVAAGVLVGLTAGTLFGVLLSRSQLGDLRDALREDIAAGTEQVALDLLRQEAASQRLRGVSTSQQTLVAGGAGRSATTDDRAVVDALVQAAVFDPSDNVRLAAIEALGAVAERPAVRDRLLALLPYQESPFVQWTALRVLSRQGGMSPEELEAELAAQPKIGDQARQELLRLLRTASEEENDVPRL